MKYGLLFVLISVILLGGCSGNPVGANDEQYNRAEEMFNTVETAYEEERAYTDFEENEVDRYSDWVSTQLEDRNLLDYSESELNEYGALTLVRAFALEYKIISTSIEFDQEIPEEDWERFNREYNLAEKALNEGTTLEDLGIEEND